MRIETQCLHEGYTPKNGEPRVMPIVQSTTYVYDSTDDVAAVFDDPTKSLIYSRFESDDSNIILEPVWRGKGYNKYRDDQKEPFESYYQWLKSLGYVASDEEKQIMFGTHPLYEVKNGK